MSELKTSYSTVDCFRTCPRKLYLSKLERWEPVERPRPLAFGSAFHEALEVYWITPKGDRFATSLNRLESAIVKWDLCPEDKVLARVLLKGYVARWGAEDPENCKAEEVIQVPILNLNGEPDDSTVLKAVLDIEGPGWAGDHKTTGSDPSKQSYWDRLIRNLQIPTYFIACEDNGNPLEYMLWDVIHSPELRMRKATPLEEREFYKRDGKYGKKGDPKPGTYLQDETMQEFEVRVTQDILTNPERYFMRRKLYRSQEVLDKVRYDLWAWSKLIQAAMEAKAFPRNEDSCFKYQRTCEFSPVCHDGVDPETSPLYRKRKKEEKSAWDF